MYNTDDEITHIAEGMRDSTLPKDEWTHAAHIAMAVWLLDRHGHAAAEIMPGLIRTYNVYVGGQNTDSEGYHHTITLASLRSIAAHMGKGSIAQRTNALLSQGFDRPDWLFQHYSKDRLFSVEARRGWVEPDLAPLPKG